MTEIASHIRIFADAPDDDFVTKRETAIKELSGKFSKARKGVPVYIRTANDLARALESNGTLSSEIATEISAAIGKEAKSFVADGHELEMKVIGTLAAIAAIDGAKPSAGILTTVDLLAVCFWSALSFQKPLAEAKLEAIRAELMTKARNLIQKSASASRRREEVNNFDCPAPKDVTADAIKASVDKAAKDSVAALRANAALDREEIDFLWWSLSDWSAALQQRYSAPTHREAAAIASGLEAGSMLRRMPAEAHKQLVLRTVLNDEKLTLLDLLETLKPRLPELRNAVPDDEVVAQCPHVFPLIAALRLGKAENNAKVRVKRTLSEWASRALLEAAILRLAQHPEGVML